MSELKSTLRNSSHLSPRSEDVKMLKVALFTERGRMLRTLLGLHYYLFSLFCTKNSFVLKAVLSGKLIPRTICDKITIFLKNSVLQKGIFKDKWPLVNILLSASVQHRDDTF